MKRLVFLLALLLIFFVSSVALADQIEMYGQMVSTDATEIDLGDVTIKNKKSALRELEGYLDQLPNLQKCDMYKSKLPREFMAELDERYPDILFGWTLYLGSYQVRTDVTAFSTKHSDTAKGYDSNYYSILKYCYQLEALDLGHNQLTDISFLKDMTDLKVLILVDNYIKDLSPLANLQKLEYLEIFKNRVVDLTPLSNMSNLRDLNVSFCKITDPSPILTLPKLERCWITHIKIDADQQAELAAAMPNVHFDFKASHSTANGWREHDRYFVIQKMFKEGVYIPFDDTVQPEVTETVKP